MSPAGEKTVSLLDSVELTYVKRALRAINMTPTDLDYHKEWAGPDSFRLKRINQLMDFPLDVPRYAEMTKEKVESLRDSISSLLLFMGRETDLNFSENRKKMEKILQEKSQMWRDTVSGFVADSSLISGVSILLAGIDLSNRLIDSAFSALTPGERDTLLREVISLWSDEDDSTDDSLKGVLPREFGVEIDTSGEVEAKDILKISRKIDREKIIKAGFVSLIALNMSLEDLNRASKKAFFVEQMTSLGKIALGGSGENHYDGNYALIVDLGGNDHYEGRFAGGIGLLPGAYPTSFVLDLGGNDEYQSLKCVSQGAGVFGVGILLDQAGDDNYRASHVSEGAGLFGVGVLLDSEGDDTYRSGFFTQGAGNFGFGILLDGGGNDTYRAFDWAQGFGSVWGYGMLFERDGNDSYYAGGHYIHHPLLPHQYRSFAQGFGMGWRADASGGIGLLLDSGGNDSYYVEVYGQGSSYWYSLGMLIDEKGNDTYTAAEYAQGAGIHLSVGILADISGKDHYFSRYGPSQGEGHDLAVGWLIDKKGDDSYQVSGGQGIGLTNSVGIFIDSQGNDTYLTTEKLGQGDANWTRGFGGIGIFLDLGGKDIYKGAPGKDNEWWIQGTFGVGIDKETR